MTIESCNRKGNSSQTFEFHCHIISGAYLAVLVGDGETLSSSLSTGIVDVTGGGGGGGGGGMGGGGG
jgi:hypothetical protein